MDAGQSNEETDWKVFFTLDREALEQEIARLQAWLDKPWQDIYAIVPATDHQDAVKTATAFKARIARIPTPFIKNTRAHRLPT